MVRKSMLNTTPISAKKTNIKEVAKATPNSTQKLKRKIDTAEKYTNLTPKSTKKRLVVPTKESDSEDEEQEDDESNSEVSEEVEDLKEDSDEDSKSDILPVAIKGDTPEKIVEKSFKTGKEVRAKTCYNCKEEGHLAADCPKPNNKKNKDLKKKKSNKQKLLCFQCGSDDHLADNCRNISRMCFKCKSFDHMAADCPLKKNYKTCFKCGSPDHILANCKDNDITIVKGCCFNCGSSDHLKADCKEQKKPLIRVCHQCKEVGHKVSKCPQSECFKCKNKGHKASNCPNK